MYRTVVVTITLQAPWEFTNFAQHVRAYCLPCLDTGIPEPRIENVSTSEDMQRTILMETANTFHDIQTAVQKLCVPLSIKVEESKYKLDQRDVDPRNP